MVQINASGASLKRINFSMPESCHALLKSVCALKGINLQDHIYQCVAEDLHKRAFEDKQTQQIVLAGTFPSDSKAYALQERIKEELKKR